MSEVPENLKYTNSHEWVRVEEDGSITIGITDHAQKALGDLVFVELPSEGDRVEADTPCGVVESVKAASDILSPINGEVVEVNEKLPDQPELVNSSPYEEGWLFRLQLDKEEEENLEKLLTPEQYIELLKEEE